MKNVIRILRCAGCEECSLVGHIRVLFTGQHTNDWYMQRQQLHLLATLDWINDDLLEFLLVLTKELCGL